MAEHEAVVSNSGLVLSDGVYDFLRQLVEKVFPGLGVLYAALAQIWHWGYEFEVGGTFAALTVFGGLLLTLSRRGRIVDPSVPPGGYDGAVVEDSIDGQTVLRVDLSDESAADLLNKKQLVIKGYDVTA
jgi:hypothetical protein